MLFLSIWGTATVMQPASSLVTAILASWLSTVASWCIYIVSLFWDFSFCLCNSDLILGVYIFALYVMVNEYYRLFYNSGLFYACLSTHFHHKSRYKFQKYCENISVSDWLQSKSKDYAQTLWLTYFTSEVGSMTIVSMNITAHVCV